MHTKRGFTLLELTVVIVIVGILATLGISQYIPSRERALGGEAKANLKLIAAAEKIYRMEVGNYYFSTNLSDINSNLKLSLTATNWSYSIINVDTFTAFADRLGSGGYLDCQYSLAYNDADGEPDPNASCIP